MPTLVKIRTDGNSKIGLGHVVRCISLAHMIKDEFSIHFYSLSLPDSLRKEIRGEGWKVTLIDSESDFMASLQGNEIVVLDGYQYDSSYQKEIKNAGAKLVCIDDYQNQHFYADLVINHAPGITENEYEGEPYTKYLLGPDYALLRPEFLKSSSNNKRDFKNGIKNIFICFGGSDPKNLTCKILEWLPKEDLTITVIIGNKYQYLNDLKQVIRKSQKLTISVKSSLTAKEMREQMINADFGIVPTSGILFETLSSELPVIAGYYTDNQKILYKGFLDLNCIYGVGEFQKKDFQDRLKKILSGRKPEDFSQSFNNVIDHKSNIRIKEQILQL